MSLNQGEEPLKQQESIVAHSSNNAPSSSGTSRYNFTEATRLTCPPPTPAQGKKCAVSAQELSNILDKLVTPSSVHGAATRENSSYENMFTPVDNPSRKRGDGFCDAPVFYLGFDFQSPETDRQEKVAVSNDSGYENVDPFYSEELEKACLEAERVSRQKAQEMSAGKVLHSPDLFTTPINQANSLLGGSSSDDTSSSSGPHQHVRRIINKPPHMQSLYVDEKSEKQWYCNTEVNKIYALVLLHGRRPTRGKQHVNNRYSMSGDFYL